MANLTPTTGFVHIGELFVCNCGIPLAKKVGIHHYELIKFYNGKKVPIKVEMGSASVIRCEVCNRGFAHLIIKESIAIKDTVSVTASSAKKAE